MSTRPHAPHPGAALEPTGNPMKDGVGASSYATDRADRPDLTVDGRPRIQPMSILTGWSVERRDPDPRGMPVFGCDGAKAGTVTDLWVDQGEPAIRYLAVELEGGDATVLLPMGFARVRRRPARVLVKAIRAEHFADVPVTKADDRITLLEEDRIVGYFAGGYRYAEPARNEAFF